MIINNWRNGFGNDGHTDVMVHSSAVDGSQVFTDSSSNNRTMSIKISGVDSYTRHSTSQYNLGTSSVKMTHPVATCANCTLYTASANSIGKQNFCFDWWFYVSTLSNGPYSDYFYVGYGDNNKANPLDNSIVLQFDVTKGRVDYIAYEDATGTNLISNNSAYNNNTWNHFAINRKGTYFYLFVNGVMLNSYNYGSVYDFSYITTPFHTLYFLSGDCSVSRVFYTEEWRHSIGDYRWDHNFIPPNRFY